MVQTQFITLKVADSQGVKQFTDADSLPTVVSCVPSATTSITRLRTGVYVLLLTAAEGVAYTVTGRLLVNAVAYEWIRTFTPDQASEDSHTLLLPFEFRVQGVLTDLDSPPVLRDASGAWGCRKVSDSSVVISAGSVMLRTGVGQYLSVVADAEDGEVYEYVPEATYGPQIIRRSMSASLPPDNPVPCSLVLDVPAMDNTSAARSSPRDFPVLRVVQGVAATVVLQLRDLSGRPLQLLGTGSIDVGDGLAVSGVINRDTIQEDDTGDGANLEVSSGASPQILGARLLYGDSGMAQYMTQVYGLYLGEGKFKFNFTPEQTNRAGLYVAEIVAFDSNSDPATSIYAKRAYLEIEPSPLSAQMSDPITIAEVRLELRDWPGVNELIDDFEISDAEIVHCIRKPIDMWNSSVPFGTTYSYQSFPYRQPWLDATCGFALQLLGTAKVRQHVPMQAAGVSVDRHVNAGAYLQMAGERIKDFKVWMLQAKQQQNYNSSFGVVPGRVARW